MVERDEVFVSETAVVSTSKPRGGSGLLDSAARGRVRSPGPPDHRPARSTGVPPGTASLPDARATDSLAWHRFRESAGPQMVCRADRETRRSIMETVRAGLVGSGFVSALHAEALHRVPGVALVAVASPTPGNAGLFTAPSGAQHAEEIRKSGSRCRKEIPLPP